jgi:predicted Zn-dependent protease
MELGRYADARTTLDRIPASSAENPSVDAVRARYDELTGRLAQARELIMVAGRTMDSDVSNPAFDRSWFHMRSAQLAYEAGDFRSAEREYAISLDDFPDNVMALMFQAQLFLAQSRWSQALTSAQHAANLYPLPQALGYEADAQNALGDRRGAAQTDALIGAENRLFDASGINDRLLANYYADHAEHLGAALRAARSDYAKRGDEIYADDTLAWVLARMGRWPQAAAYERLALRTGSVDPLLRYHAAVIAARCEPKSEAILRGAAAQSGAVCL